MLSSFLLFLLVCHLTYFFPPHRPFEPVSSPSFSCCFCPCNSYYMFLFTTWVCCSCRLSFLIFLHHVLQNTSRFSFVFFYSFFSFLSHFFLRSGLSVCCVIVSGTAAFHLLYLDELRLFGLLCFTVCDRRICILLGWRGEESAGTLDVLMTMSLGRKNGLMRRQHT